MNELREALRRFLRYEVPPAPEYVADELVHEEGYDRRLIRYDGDSIPAQLLSPRTVMGPSRA